MKPIISYEVKNASFFTHLNIKVGSVQQNYYINQSTDGMWSWFTNSQGWCANA